MKNNNAAYAALAAGFELDRYDTATARRFVLRPIAGARILLSTDENGETSITGTRHIKGDWRTTEEQVFSLTLSALLPVTTLVALLSGAVEATLAATTALKQA